MYEHVRPGLVSSITKGMCSSMHICLFSAEIYTHCLPLKCMGLRNSIHPSFQLQVMSVNL